MRNVLAVISLSALIFVVPSARLEYQQAKGATMSHTEWVANVLKEIQNLKIGMTRKDLLKSFILDGGLSSGTTFIYRDCPFIKVDVEFQMILQQGKRVRPSPDDKITQISRPYLANPVLD